MPASNSLLQTVLLHNFFQSHLLMKLAVILNIYHKPHAITDSRTQSYRTQAHFVTGNLAPIMHVSWCRHTNRHTHIHTPVISVGCLCVFLACFVAPHLVDNQQGYRRSVTACDKKKKNDHSGSTGVSSHTHAQTDTNTHTQAKICLHRHLCILHFIGRNSHNTSVTKCNWIQVMG